VNVAPSIALPAQYLCLRTNSADHGDDEIVGFARPSVTYAKRFGVNFSRPTVFESKQFILVMTGALFCTVRLPQLREWELPVGNSSRFKPDCTAREHVSRCASPAPFFGPAPAGRRDTRTVSGRQLSGWRIQPVVTCKQRLSVQSADLASGLVPSGPSQFAGGMNDRTMIRFPRLNGSQAHDQRLPDPHRHEVVRVVDAFCPRLSSSPASCSPW
jgi:hypothetical protein